MSIPVDPNQLETELERFGRSAFLLTVCDDQTSHVAHMTLSSEEGILRCPVSRTAARNVAHRPKVVLLWPPWEPDGYSMIVDADCSVEDEELCITPTSGVLHRPAAADTSTGPECGSDCAPLGS
ncbi:MAG: pyridoxamine 5'-phosphate oxidase family protein [Actinomycetota bacterium]|nr:pyridoxamine 5'-phosphate oxidase family protein [Actinomycetota bacterium]